MEYIGTHTEFNRATHLKIMEMSGNTEIQGHSYYLGMPLKEGDPELNEYELSTMPDEEYCERVKAIAEFVENKEKITDIDPEQARIRKEENRINIDIKLIRPANFYSPIKISNSIPLASDVSIILSLKQNEKKIVEVHIQGRKGEIINTTVREQQIIGIEKAPKTIPEIDEQYIYTFDITTET